MRVLHALRLPAAVIAALFSTDPYAACTANPTLQPSNTFPTLSGRLVYHSYVSYGDGTSNLYLYDFPSQTTTRLDNPSWNLSDPMNAHFSPDGKRIAFMAQQDGNWNIFVWAIGSPTAPSNITASIGGRNEDAKFSFDGKRIVFKHEGDIRLATLRFNADNTVGVSAWQNITSDGWTIEESMPYLTPSGKYVVYTVGSDGMSIYRKNLATGQTAPFAVPPAGAHDYYPIVRDYSAYFFTRASSGSGYDQIMMALPNAASSTAYALPLNKCNANNSDAAPVDEDHLIFPSGAYDPPYGLVIGDIKTGMIWRLNQSAVNINDGKQKLGASYTAAR
ncbi:MAG: PD40 domain-containing protein [Gammaproteobacteria bacterium]|nr:PD40 domain-containing protein [Gammaproteobacteria bacterium]